MSTSSGGPRVSVVIPCFNLGAFIDEAVDSVMAQTFADWEIIIVNDGSTDSATNEHLRDYRRPGTRVITTSNRGLGAARNTAIAAARGVYLCALDADDVLAPTYFEKAVGILDHAPRLSFASPWLETFGHESWTWRPERCDFPTLLDECTVCTAALVRTTAIEAVGGYDESMPAQGYEDWDLWISLVERGLEGVIIPEVLFRYRRRLNSMSYACVAPATHSALMEYLVSKHRHSFETHLHELLLRKEAGTARVLKSVYELEQQGSALAQTIARKRADFDLLKGQSHSPETATPTGNGDALVARVSELEQALQHEGRHRIETAAALARAAAEVEALRASASWKLTAPVRALYGLLLKMRGNTPA